MKSPQPVYRGRAELAECPLWVEGALWWVDLAVGTLNRWDPRTGQNTSRATGGFLGAVTPSSDGRWLLARQRNCAFLNWETGEMTDFAVPREGVAEDMRFNDGKVGPDGNFWVGTLSLKQRPHQAGLFVLNPAGEFRRVRSGLSLANGLAWTAAGDRFFHIDTPTRRVQTFAFDAERSQLAEERTLIQFSDTDGTPDGMTCDAAGDLWIALWGGSAVIYVDGKTGAIRERYSLPVAQVSSCTFGGPDLRTLYITSAWEGFSMEQRASQPLAGSIFALETNTPGLRAGIFGERA